MARLWDKGAPLDALIHRFTVGNDPQLDRALVGWDCLGSAAHARTLQRARLLTAEEADRLVAELARIHALDREGRFVIPDELEDCHTAIEAHLTAALGELGEKIHTGRSRNDQVATAMRLYMRRHALDWIDLLAATIETLGERITRDGQTPMPGYTHMQPAMPSSVGLWLASFAEALLEQLRAALDLLSRLDACPLGSGAGFGVALPLDRDHTAALLGFARVQRNAIDVQNSRGRMEIYFVRVAADIAAVLEKLSCDLLLFSMGEFGFFSLPESLTTGSSIMPQKKNPDVLELMRARAGRLRARLHELEWVAGKLPSSYHRDLQLTKEPALRAAADIEEMLPVMRHVIASLAIHADRLAAAMRPELYATDAAFRLVQQGVPFRRAYRSIADELRAGRFTAAAATADPADRSGHVTAAQLAALASDVREALAAAAVFRTRFDRAEAVLRGTGLDGKHE